MDYEKLTPKQFGYLTLFEQIYHDVTIEWLKFEFMKVITPEQLEQVVESLLNNFELPSLAKCKGQA